MRLHDGEVDVRREQGRVDPVEVVVRHDERGEPVDAASAAPDGSVAGWAGGRDRRRRRSRGRRGASSRLRPTTPATTDAGGHRAGPDAGSRGATSSASARPRRRRRIVGRRSAADRSATTATWIPAIAAAPATRACGAAADDGSRERGERTRPRRSARTPPAPTRERAPREQRPAPAPIEDRDGHDEELERELVVLCRTGRRRSPSRRPAGCR